ncbi:hypothetical protein COU55_02485 [Candidatus Pacearchaeota archaeon CG10_big_fil_rev_8_21_14_0_10_31_59]|nr:MAG: hypothetical protein COU55_02485 [Candidatus Pacearchaeota archaeon CG10_big_fil_rev_8_21_14_0_10_31_59]
MGKNISAEYFWLDREIGRFKREGRLIPEDQKKIYHLIGKNFCTEKRVVDVGCSCGVGSNYLSQYASYVLGIDVNKEAIKFSNEAFSRPSLEFAVLNIESPDTIIPSTSFDVIVMIEVLEHLGDYETGLHTFRKFFSRKSSTGFITVPNINNEQVKIKDAMNELHLHHWTAKEFYDIISKYFQAVTMYSVEKLKKFAQEEIVDENTETGIIIAKVEDLK